ncbi:hypothetical protein B0I37DRAFT_411567 [Chaetomium sp. MPI-CAGE-AT-0009]|nr:hypothetical protein B0I37DRAFT_411567 [Chaetomium sp. MPI-CAGE-AT-0009]
MGFNFLEKISDTNVLPSEVVSGAETAAGENTSAGYHDRVMDQETVGGETTTQHTVITSPSAADPVVIDAAKSNAAIGVPLNETPFSETSADTAALDPAVTNTIAAAVSSPDNDTRNTTERNQNRDRPIFEKPQKLLRATKFHIRIGGLSVTLNRHGLGCARTAKWERKIKVELGGWPLFESRANGLGAGNLERTKLYFVVGIFDPWHDRPRETLIKVGAENGQENFPDELSKGVRSLRGLRRFFSLKSVARFSVYECGEGARHTHIDDPDAEHYLRTLFEDWRAGSVLKPEWESWVMKNLNRGSPEPTVNSYSIRLVLRWDIYRIALAIMLPVVLSIVAGVTYQQVTEDIQTAWTIASYVVTAVGVIDRDMGPVVGSSPWSRNSTTSLELAETQLVSRGAARVVLGPSRVVLA